MIMKRMNLLGLMFLLMGIVLNSCTKKPEKEASQDIEETSKLQVSKEEAESLKKAYNRWQEAIKEEQNYERLLIDYASSQDENEKVEILEKLIKANSVYSHVNFYSLLSSLDISEIPYFKTALRECGTGELLVNISAFLKDEQESLKEFTEIYKDKSLNSAEKEKWKEAISVTELLLNNFNERINSLEPEFRLIADKDYKILISALKRISKEKIWVKEEGRIYLAGPLLGLKALEEKGFELFLRSIETKDDKLMAMTAMRAFGPHAVVPLLKQYENPALSEGERAIAGTLIMFLPETKDVIDKVVEAYIRGWFFPREEETKKFTTLADDIKWGLRWWGGLIEHRYQGSEFFVRYVAEKYLYKPDKQEKIIQLLASIDIKTATSYFEELNFNTLSEEALDAVIFSIGIPTSEKHKRDRYAKERFSLFCKIFAELEKNKREEKKLVYTIDDFPPSFQETFVVSNFKNFTGEEKEIAVFNCSQLPLPIKKRVYNSIRDDCGPELIKLIEFYEKE